MEQPAVAEVKADIVADVEAEAVADVVAEAEQPAPAVVAEQPVVEVQPQLTAAAVVSTAPMTRAPAPEYQPEAPRQSDWVRPAFDFEGKGSAGGHSATHQATAPATRPQSAE
ncbi:Ribonuclease E [compost metagenome]